MTNKKRQNLFEIDNARNLTREELVATFLPTKAFWRLLSAKHHIVLGSRGSGKTALAKMLSHDHLSKLNVKGAREIIHEKTFIGVYVPTELEWVSGLKNKPWLTEREKEEFFQWRLNLSTCLALLATLKSCLEIYFPDKGRRASLEAELATEIATAWSGQALTLDTLRGVERFLQQTEHAKQLQLARTRAHGKLSDGEMPVGIPFMTDLFGPLRRGLTLASEALRLPDHSCWFLCIDEAEFLEEMHHRILNSHLRAFSKNLCFKITTMPYHHYTLATNTNVPLDVGHDFEYVYIDQDPVIWAGARGTEGKRFADTIFEKRAEISGFKGKGLTLGALLGHSILLEPKFGEWSPQSSNMQLLRKYANAETQSRAERLCNSPADFMDQIGRKIIPALLLRDAVENQKGRGELEVYSGEMMLIRCGDANPRRLIRIFNKFRLETRWKRGWPRRRVTTIRPREQTRILKAFSASTLNPVESEEVVGPALYRLLQQIGSYMHYALHDIPLSSDQTSSITVDLRTSEYAPLIRKAVALGLLFPNINARNPDQMPEGESKFHLAYVLAPHFDILPRRGKAVSLSTVVREHQDTPRGRGQQETLNLFK
ncbi:MAG: hypothetical protein LAO76_10270 [Acidobacteriia bacterium]|nr:hypothetical protein [Terriglobia bacterium]